MHTVRIEQWTLPSQTTVLTPVPPQPTDQLLLQTRLYSDCSGEFFRAVGHVNFDL